MGFHALWFPSGLGQWESQQEIGGSRRAAAATAKSLQSCPTLCDPIDGNPPGSPVPGILQARNTGVGCHFLLQCMKVKSESEVAQSCPTLSDPMVCSLPGSSVHGIFQARVLEWGAIAFSARRAGGRYLLLVFLPAGHFRRATFLDRRPYLIQGSPHYKAVF